MLHQTHSQTQSFGVLPQQIQLLKLFHLNQQELSDRIEEELMENPALEDCGETDEKDEVDDFGQTDDEVPENDIPDYKVEHNNYASDQKNGQQLFRELPDIRKDLKEQLSLVMKGADLKTGEYLIDSVNDDGLLSESIEDLATDLSFSQNKEVFPFEIEIIRQQIMDLEPRGVGCQSIREFLLFQLSERQVKTQAVSNAIRILNDYFIDLSRHHLEKIAGQLHLDADEFRDVLNCLSGCSMKPMAGLSDTGQPDTIIIDFVVRQNGETIEASLLRQRSATLFVRHSIFEGSRNDKATTQYQKSKIQAAQWFVNAIQQREATMLRVMNILIKLQKDYFVDGDDRLLKPMILKDVAELAGIDISTASRITCNKYADTHFGAILLKNLFSTGIANKKGHPISNRTIQIAIADAVEKENKMKPYTDQQLVDVLAKQGFDIARRTVAKYREQQRIPVLQIRALRKTVQTH